MAMACGLLRKRCMNEWGLYVLGGARIRDSNLSPKLKITYGSTYYRDKLALFNCIIFFTAGHGGIPHHMILFFSRRVCCEVEGAWDDAACKERGR